MKDTVSAVLTLFKHFRWKKAFIITDGKRLLFLSSMTIHIHLSVFGLSLSLSLHHRPAGQLISLSACRYLFGEKSDFKYERDGKSFSPGLYRGFGKLCVCVFHAISARCYACFPISRIIATSRCRMKEKPFFLRCLVLVFHFHFQFSSLRLL